MIKKVILLAAAVVAVAALNFYSDPSGGKPQQSGPLENLTAKIVLLMQKEGGGPAAVQGKADVNN